MRLIDADALTEKYGDWYIEEGTEEGFIGTVKQLIDAQPTVQPDTTTHDSIPAETGKNDDDGTSGDCISRRQSVDTLRKMQTYKLFAGDDMLLIDQVEAQTELMMLPSAQPERKTGHWILDRSGAYCCSKCMEPCAGYVMMKPRDKFCKMCGSRNEVME